MTEYRCRYADAKGRIGTKLVSASSEAEAVRAFGDPALVLLEVTPVTGRERGASSRGKYKKALLDFTEMMDLLTESGLSLKDALEVLASMKLASGSGKLASELLEALHRGLTFPLAVEASSDTFPPMYRGMVRLGDRIGSVERIFPRLASYLKEQKKLKDKVTGALAYPLLILAVSIVGTLALAFFALPKLEAIFLGFGGEAAEHIRGNMENIKGGFMVTGLLLLTSCAALFILRLVMLVNSRIALAWDRFLLSVPLIGRFIAAWESLNLAFALETLASGGVPIEAALQESETVISNRAYGAALGKVREELIKGSSLALAFSTRKEFPSYLGQWIGIGERTGKTEQVFSQIRNYFQAEVERRSTLFMNLVEPALTIIIGIFVLVLVMGVILPLFSLYGTLV